ncbi:MAG: lasso peptide biosynthesis B2 protein [Solirubrobacterales bacterium]|nr:lasso peptide biosynthesis B2 protein [Solirubrobacterales bacterium]
MTALTRPVIPTRHELGPAGKARVAVEVLATYARVRWLLRREDARGAVARLRAAAAGAPPLDPREARIASVRLAWVVKKVITPLPADTRCLFSSLTLLAVLARRGIPVTLVIAVRPQPFAAHAWVERDDGRPLLDPGDADFERLVEL